MADRGILRAAVAGLLAITLALYSGHQSALAYWRGQAPSPAPARYAGDWQYRVMANDPVLIADPGHRGLDTAGLAQTARAALTASPYNAAALRQLGALADRTRPGNGWPYYRAAETVTRRDLPAQVSLINQTIQRGDVGAVLTHFDRALRVYVNAYPELMPSLNAAAADPAVQPELVKFAHSPWFAPFMAQLLRATPAPQDYMAFVRQVQSRLDAGAADRLTAQMLGQLMVLGRYDAARSWLAQVAPARGAALAQFGFTGAAIDPASGVLAWTFPEHSGMSAALASTGKLELTVDAGRSAPVAVRTTLLLPGRYVLRHTLAGTPGTTPARVSWQMACLAPGAGALAWHSEPARGPVMQAVDLPVTFAPDCVAQQWTLSASSVSTQLVSSVWVANLSLVRQ